MPLRILELCLSQAYGGLEMSAAGITRALAQRGITVSLCCPPKTRLAQEGGIAVHCIGRRIPYVDPLTSLRLLRLVRSLRPDIIHVHQSQDLPFAAYVKARFPRVKVIYTQHMESARVKKDFFHRWVYERIDLILGVTKRIRDILPGTIPLAPDRIRHLYLGVDLPDLGPKESYRIELRGRLGLKDGDFLILFPGRLDPLKGQTLMIRALDRLRRKGVAPFVVFAGAPTGDVAGYEQTLRNLVSELDLAKQVRFTGYIRNLDEYYAAADVSVLATRHETFGLVLLEAMAWQTPVIASRAGGPLEIITEGHDGYFFASMDEGDLADTLSKAMNNRDDLTRMGQNARNTVEQKFQFSMTMDRLIEIFGRITAEKAF